MTEFWMVIRRGRAIVCARPATRLHAGLDRLADTFAFLSGRVRDHPALRVLAALHAARHRRRIAARRLLAEVLALAGAVIRVRRVARLPGVDPTVHVSGASGLLRLFYSMFQFSF